MANISAIKLPNGTTYNLVDNTSGYTKNTGTITSIKTTAGAHTAINVTSGAAVFNVPTKTSHLTNDSGFITNAGVTGVKGNSESTYRTGQVNLTAANIGAATTNHTHFPGDMVTWKANEGYFGMAGNIDMLTGAKVGAYASNKTFGLPAEAITIEYSVDNGVTWVDYGASDNHKKNLFAETRTGCNTYLGKGATAEANSTNNQLRITIEPFNRYTSLDCVYMWISTNGNTVYYDLEASTIGAKTTFTKIFENVRLIGWSGHNIQYFSAGAFGGGSNQTSNRYAYRLTFRQTAILSNYPSANIYDIRFYGKDVYSSTGASGSMLRTNHLYSWDGDLNVTFPAQVNGTINVNTTVGTLAITHGGTGATSATNAINNLLTGLPVWSAVPTDTTYFIRQDTGGADSYGKVPASTLWSYISGKLPSWSQASSKPSYTFSEIGSKPTTLSGYGITDAYTKTEVNGLVSGVLHYKGTKATVADVAAVTSKSIGDVWHVTADGSEWAYDGNAWQELGTAIDLSNYVTHGNTGSATTGITATTTATKTTLGTATSVTGVSGSTTASKASGSNGSASNWVFEDVACDNITAWSAGSGSASLTFTMDTTDTKKLKISFSHSHTAPSLTYSAKTASHVKSGGNGTAPSWSFTDVTVPKAAASATSVPNVSVTSATVTITDNGHTHTI